MNVRAFKTNNSFCRNKCTKVGASVTRLPVCFPAHSPQKEKVHTLHEGPPPVSLVVFARLGYIHKCTVVSCSINLQWMQLQPAAPRRNLKKSNAVNRPNLRSHTPLIYRNHFVCCKSFEQTLRLFIVPDLDGDVDRIICR